MLIDLHAKTHFSEGVSLTPQQVFKQAQKEGLDGVAICDTATTAHAGEILDIAKSEFPDLIVFIGVEIPTARGLLLGFVPYIDDFFLNEEWAWLTHRTTPSAEAVLDLFDEKNGLVIAARPYDLDIPFNMGDYIFQFDRLGAVEVFNPKVGTIQNNFALEAATFMGVGTVGGSDPTDDVSVIGRYATFFQEDIASQRLFVDALRQAEYWAVQLGESTSTKKSSRKRSSRSSRKSRGSRGRGRGRGRGRR